MITKQHRPTVNELACEERCNRVPAPLRRKNLSPKGHKGICVGRGELLQGLSEYFAQQWRNSAGATLRQCGSVVPGEVRRTVR